MAKDTLSVTDNRTGKSYEIPIEEGGVIRASALREIKTGPEDFGMMSYDPALVNTATCKSRITFIDGDKGILRYRGYPIEELAEKSNFLEVAYLIVKGELPDKKHFATWEQNIKIHTMVHENIRQFMQGFRHDAHPMGMLLGTVGAMSTFYPESKEIFDLETRRLQTRRLIGKIPTLAAWAFRHTRGLPYIYPDNELSYTGNFLSMLFKMTELQYKPNPILEKALDVIFILHADHEQNCSTNAVRAVGSSDPDPYACIAAGIAALYGPLHGGANEAAIRMLMEIGSKEKIPGMIKAVKAGDTLLQGFGHRVYKNYDPRAKILKKLAYDVFEVTGRNPMIDVAIELERIALEDDYFIKRKLYPNVDFYSGITLRAMGFPTTMFTVLFALARTVGWIAQWKEMIEDPHQKLGRPRQLYTGSPQREYQPVSKRK